MRVVLLAVLASRALRSAVVPPRVLRAVDFAFRRRLDTHNVGTRVFGFLMLRPHFPG